MERVRARKVVEITSLSLRQVQEMSAKGLIPSAAKLGSVWTFNERTIRRWVGHREREACRTISTSETGSGMPALNAAGVNYDEAYGQLLGLRPGSA